MIPERSGEAAAAPGGRPLRILMVTDRVPGHDTGYGIRVRNVIDGLRAAGDLHVVLIDSSTHGAELDDHDGYTTHRVRVENPPAWSKGVRLGRLLPANVRYHRTVAARAALLRTIGTDAWDLVWCSRARVHVLTHGVLTGSRVVDLDDLNDRLLRSKISDRREQHGALASWPLNVRDRLDVRLWSRLQHRVADAADTVVVCSPRDQAHLGVDNCAVVPNGYPEPSSSPVVRDASAPRRILFVGPMTYEPNRLAVDWLVKSVLPRVRAALPVELVVVGEHGGVRTRGASQPGVTFTGHVADVGPHYAAATIAVTPLHSGGGTRIKVIEALARAVPLVSTSFGCMGHGLVPGRDLLVADDPASFADACVLLLEDEALRAEIATNGRRFYQDRLTATATIAAVASVARATAELSFDGFGRRGVPSGQNG